MNTKLRWSNRSSMAAAMVVSEKKSSLQRGFAAPICEVGCCRVIHPVAGVDCCVTEGDGKHRIPDAGRPDEEDVGGVVEETTGSEFTDHCLVNGGSSREIEVVDGPWSGEAC